MFSISRANTANWAPEMTDRRLKFPIERSANIMSGLKRVLRHGREIVSRDGVAVYFLRDEEIEAWTTRCVSGVVNGQAY